MASSSSQQAVTAAVTAATTSSKRPKIEAHSPTPHPPLPFKTLPPPPLHPHLENPSPTPNSTTPAAAAEKGKSIIPPSQEDLVLSNSTHLTREEVLRRRSHNLKQLAKVYRDHYWALMEELKVQYREYVWKYGLSPFQEDNERNDGDVAGGGVCEGSGETNANNNNASTNNGGNLLCAFYGCKYKAMALTSFCQLHILADKNQQLFKPCNYVIKSALAGAITCGKPILRSAVPSLCNVHLQKAQKHVNRALRKAGLNVSASSKPAPKFHNVVAEFVREIQNKRREAARENRKKEVTKNEKDS